MNRLVVLTEDQIERLLNLVYEHKTGVEAGEISYGQADAQWDVVTELTELEAALRTAEDVRTAEDAPLISHGL